MKIDFAHLAVLCALAWPFSARAAAALTNAAQVRALTQTEAAQKIPVRLRGIILDDGLDGCVVQDESAAIYLAGSRGLLQPHRRRELVLVEGVTDPGDFAPIVRVTKLTKVGTGELPEPQRVTLEQLLGGQFDAQWVEVVGIVRSCETIPKSDHYTALELATGGERLTILHNFPLPSGGFVDAEVRVRGVCFNQHNTSRQLVRPVLHLPTGEPIRVDKPAATDAFTLPLTSVSQLLRFAPDGSYGHRVHATGIVLFDDVGEFFWLRDGEQGLRVRSQQKTELQPGDAVEVVGFPMRGDYSPVLEDAVFRKLSTTAPPAPVRITTNSLALQHDADLVEIEAVLKDLHAVDNDWQLTLDWRGIRVLAALRLPKNVSLPAAWQLTSRVRVTGLCEISSRDSIRSLTGVLQPSSFQILLRNVADLQVLRPPPWWTPQKFAWLAIAIALASVLGVVIVVSIARRRVREQKARRALAEAEFAAILHERNRIAREIHDTLAQGLGAVSLQLELAKNFVVTAPDDAIEYLGSARSIVRSSLADARASIWNMRSQVLETGDLVTALTNILRQLTHGTPVQGEVKILGTARRLSPLVESNFLRVGQEAISNAAKHAQAKNITVTLDFSGQQPRLIVRDNGRGFDPARPPKSEGGFGLVGLRERAKEIHAELQLHSAPGQGTAVTLAM